ncbi:hypothetical protein DNU06_06970 [Putridiphycobacter roseus]|uniref:Uncharacterized protein n=1 Tax=Putridiphycobacter roseus TaxID=2219161 RepID=A0A2W1N1A3_9FLAO|nr:hypothetical protein [Putridiphycobacter roseus]PZE17564.1 hypothetical protein DNU06_06970 [Putridiphycobacter roseus]
MDNNLEKPSPEAKALSLFLMAFKSTNAMYSDKSKYTKRLWSMARSGEISSDMYTSEILRMLKSCGGYEQVIEKTVKYYIDKTGEWRLNGDDQYCIDAQKVADSMLNK